MKKTYIWLGVAVIGAIILTRTSVVNALLLFLLLGIVPGTDISLSSSVMFLLIATVSWVLIFRFTPIVQLCTRFVAFLAAKAAKHTKAHLPRRRYSKI